MFTLHGWLCIVAFVGSASAGPIRYTNANSPLRRRFDFSNSTTSFDLTTPSSTVTSNVALSSEQSGTLSGTEPLTGSGALTSGTLSAAKADDTAVVPLSPTVSMMMKPGATFRDVDGNPVATQKDTSVPVTMFLPAASAPPTTELGVTNTANSGSGAASDPSTVTTLSAPEGSQQSSRLESGSGSESLQLNSTIPPLASSSLPITSSSIASTSSESSSSVVTPTESTVETTASASQSTSTKSSNSSLSREFPLVPSPTDAFTSQSSSLLPIASIASPSASSSLSFPTSSEISRSSVEQVPTQASTVPNESTTSSKQAVQDPVATGPSTVLSVPVIVTVTRSDSSAEGRNPQATKSSVSSAVAGPPTTVVIPIVSSPQSLAGSPSEGTRSALIVPTEKPSDDLTVTRTSTMTSTRTSTKERQRPTGKVPGNDLSGDRDRPGASEPAGPGITIVPMPPPGSGEPAKTVTVTATATVTTTER